MADPDNSRSKAQEAVVNVLSLALSLATGYWIYTWLMPDAKEDRRPDAEVIAKTSAEQDTDDWYVLGGNISTAALMDPRARTALCKPHEGPGQLIDTAQRVGMPVQVVDKEKVNGRVVHVQVMINDGAMELVRGTKRCGRLVAAFNKGVQEAETKRVENLARYK